jgi:hypothetical protein
MSRFNLSRVCQGGFPAKARRLRAARLYPQSPELINRNVQERYIAANVEVRTGSHQSRSDCVRAGLHIHPTLPPTPGLFPSLFPTQEFDLIISTDRTQLPHNRRLGALRGRGRGHVVWGATWASGSGCPSYNE